jgi:DNA invertase Pin-like site-specific DNA recombinase
MHLIRRKLALNFGLTDFFSSGRLRRMAKELTVREMGRMGGKARAAKYSKRQLRAWAKLAGRKPKLNEEEWVRLFAMLKAGKTQEECACEFGISTRTIGRAVAKRKG